MQGRKRQRCRVSAARSKRSRHKPGGLPNCKRRGCDSHLEDRRIGNEVAPQNDNSKHGEESFGGAELPAEWRCEANTEAMRPAVSFDDIPDDDVADADRATADVAFTVWASKPPSENTLAAPRDVPRSRPRINFGLSSELPVRFSYDDKGELAPAKISARTSAARLTGIRVDTVGSLQGPLSRGRRAPTHRPSLRFPFFVLRSWATSRHPTITFDQK